MFFIITPLINYFKKKKQIRLQKNFLIQPFLVKNDLDLLYVTEKMVMKPLTHRMISISQNVSARTTSVKSANATICPTPLLDCL